MSFRTRFAHDKGGFFGGLAGPVRHKIEIENQITVRRGSVGSVIARRGIEIPLENINNVNFSQGVFERLLGAGDLLIESAGETGQSEFRDIPRPDDFQALLYRTREVRTVALAKGDPSPSEQPSPDATERLHRLAALPRDGVLSDAAYEEKRRKLLDEI